MFGGTTALSLTVPMPHWALIGNPLIFGAAEKEQSPAVAIVALS